ncbi:protein SDA1 homolog [Stomoxys calcitrans]|uniref:Uncharacterized protein n=1 Tax=Stomoxys calcitrans TaxID=35570 RepID=A0A1I8PH26_STOCA|nr:protein SDA1 homolog [Stomoxys calcitrans]
MKLSLILLLVSGLAIALADPARPQRGMIHQINAGVAGPNPYIFLTVPRGRSQSLVQGFEVIDSDNNNDDDDADDEEPLNLKQRNSKHTINDELDHDEEEDMDMANSMEEQMDENEDEDADDMTVDVMKDFAMSDKSKKNQRLTSSVKNAKTTPMMVSRETAGAIMVPDEIIEIEGQSVIDEKTGKPALLLPRSVLDSIPDGSVVALMERPDEGRSSEEERANRVVVRRRRKGSRRNVKRRRGNGRRRRRGNRRRPNKRVRVMRVGGNRRRGNRRRVGYQG